MFVTKMNNKQPLYVSPVTDKNLKVVDALDIAWEALTGYAYCPIASDFGISKKTDNWLTSIVTGL